MRSKAITKKQIHLLNVLYGDAELKQAKKSSPKTDKPYVPSEAQEQIALVTWARSIGLPLYSNANAGKRSFMQGRKEVAMGLTRGVSDLFLRKPSYPFHGFYIEMKKRGKKPTPEQVQWIEDCRKDGYRAEYYDDWVKAKVAIEDYLRGEVK